jgi:hypothetical protein
VIAKPAAWRLADAPPPEPAQDREHADLIVSGLPHGLDGVGLEAVGGATRGRWERAEVHVHDLAELNVVLPVTAMTCEVVLGDERYEVEGTASIVVPPGLPHAVTVTSGSGYMLTVALP